VVEKARVSESREVAVREIEYTSNRALHDRYAIDAVPTLVIADHEGIVRKSFQGPVTATDLWAAVAEVRR
jgi:thioredoxin-related protein